MSARTVHLRMRVQLLRRELYDVKSELLGDGLLTPTSTEVLHNATEALRELYYLIPLT